MPEVCLFLFFMCACGVCLAVYMYICMRYSCASIPVYVYAVRLWYVRPRRNYHDPPHWEALAVLIPIVVLLCLPHVCRLFSCQQALVSCLFWCSLLSVCVVCFGCSLLSDEGWVVASLAQTRQTVDRHTRHTHRQSRSCSHRYTHSHIHRRRHSRRHRYTHRHKHRDRDRQDSSQCASLSMSLCLS